VARLESGHTPSRNNDSYWDGDIPWIGIKDARDHNGRRILDTLQTVTKAGIENSAARLLPVGTVCLSRTASVGYALVMGREMATSQDFVNWVCSGDLEPEFLMHLFLAERESLLRFAKGTVHKTIYFPEAKALNVCIPERDEQREIVAAIESYFSRLDATTATLERVQRNLERYRASVLKAAVEGRLVPTEAELAKKERRDYEPASALLKRILAERRRRWEEAELTKLKAKGKPPTDDRWKARYEEPAAPDTDGLPELPEGWCWASVDAAGDVLLGRRRAPEYGGAQRPYLRVANVRDDRLDLSVIKTMPFEDDHFERHRLVAGDILVSEGQSPELIGQSAIFPPGIEGMCFQSTLHRFRAHPQLTTPEFAQLVFRSHVKTGVFRRFASITTNIAHLVLNRFKVVPIPLPPLREQSRIVESAGRLLTLVEHSLRDCLRQRSRIARLRQSILKWAFEGRLLAQSSPAKGALG
jgi:type I restriction enzyme S subunit